MNKRTINRALRPLGLEIQNNRDGYSYFTSRRNGGQIGESVFACWLSSYTVPQWVELGKWALKQHRRDGVPFAYAVRKQRLKISKKDVDGTTGQ